MFASWSSESAESETIHVMASKNYLHETLYDCASYMVHMYENTSRALHTLCYSKDKIHCQFNDITTKASIPQSWKM